MNNKGLSYTHFTVLLSTKQSWHLPWHQSCIFPSMNYNVLSCTQLYSFIEHKSAIMAPSKAPILQSFVNHTSTTIRQSPTRTSPTPSKLLSRLLTVSFITGLVPHPVRASRGHVTGPAPATTSRRHRRFHRSSLRRETTLPRHSPRHASFLSRRSGAGASSCPVQRRSCPVPRPPRARRQPPSQNTAPAPRRAGDIPPE